MAVLSVDGQLASLSELLRTPVDATNERLSACVGVLVLLQILRKREGLLAVLALVILAVEVNQVVSLQ